MRGENCGGTEADVWAGSVTMMKVLVGDEKITWSTEQVSCHAYYIMRRLFLNQVCTSHRPVCTWYIKIVLVCMSVFVCLLLKELITSGVIYSRQCVIG